MTEKRPMIPQRTGRGERVDYELSCYGTDTIHWVDREGEAAICREPKQKSTKFLYPGIFTAAGKVYTSWKQLCGTEGPQEGFYKDRFGRKVFAYRERFPCFDSYDYLHENRYYRWFFILEDGTLTRVHHTDERQWIHVTEDVGSIECKCWEEMNRSGFFDWCD